MPTSVTSAAISRARKLRRDMTDGERRLWSELKEFRHLYGVHARKLTTADLSDAFDGCIEEILRELGLMEEAA